MQRKDAIGGGIFAVLGLSIFLITLGYPVLEDNHPGPALFPQILAVLFMSLGALIVYGGLTAKKETETVKARVLLIKYLDPLIVLLLIVGYMVFSDFLGFFITSCILLTLMMLRLKVAVWKSVVIAIFLTIFVNLMFAKLLRVPLPPGLFRL